jgi:hypothetical protein
MTNPSKAKGDAGEREIAALLADLTGFPVRRKLGAGRQDDQGDLDGIPDTVVQVVNRRDLWAAMRLKPPACEIQQANAGATFGATAVRMVGGRWLFVLTPAQYATYVREAL